MKIFKDYDYRNIPSESNEVNDLVDNIASFFETEENWKALKNCWLENDRSNDLRKLLHTALKE